MKTSKKVHRNSAMKATTDKRTAHVTADDKADDTAETLALCEKNNRASAFSSAGLRIFVIVTSAN